jgi:hypothetical protein
MGSSKETETRSKGSPWLVEGGLLKIFDYVVIHIRSSVVTLTALLSVLGFSAHVHAQQPILLKNVNVIDGTGAPAQPNRTVIIEGDRIQSISTGQIRTPANAKVVDMNGQTIMPLIINTHGHLGLVKGTSQSVANQTEENIRHQLLRYQDYGVGAVLSMGTDGQKFAEIREASRRGTLPGADVYSAGIGFGAKDGVPPASMGFSNVFRPTKSSSDFSWRSEAPQPPGRSPCWRVFSPCTHRRSAQERPASWIPACLKWSPVPQCRTEEGTKWPPAIPLS